MVDEVWEDVPIYDPRSIIPSVFPGARITSTSRSSTDRLSRRNPRSQHIDNPNAFDMAPIKGMTYEEFQQKMRDEGYEISHARDEVKNPSAWATGPHWHGVITKGPTWETVNTAPETPQAPIPAGTGNDPLAGAAAGYPVDPNAPETGPVDLPGDPVAGRSVAGSNLGPENVPGGSWAERVGTALATGVLPQEYAGMPLAAQIDALGRIMAAGNEAIRGTPLEALALAFPLGGAEAGIVAPVRPGVRNMSDIPEDVVALQKENPGELVGIVSDEMPVPVNDNIQATAPEVVRGREPDFIVPANDADSMAAQVPTPRQVDTAVPGEAYDALRPANENVNRVDYDAIANEAQQAGDPQADLYWQSKTILDSGNVNIPPAALDNLIQQVAADVDSHPLNRGILENLQATRARQEELLNQIPDEALTLEDKNKVPPSANDNQSAYDAGPAEAPLDIAKMDGGDGEGPTRTDDPVDRLTAYLKRATRLRGDQSALYSAERRKRVGEMLKARQNTSGEAGFAAEKSALGGELPKVEFEPVRDQFTQDDLNELFNRVRDSEKVSPFESIRAREGLTKLLDGILPQQNEINILERVFGEDFVKTALSNRSKGQKFLSAVGKGLNLPRALMSTADFSAPLRQGVFLIGRKEYWNALPGMYKYAFNKKSYEGMMDAMRADPDYDLLTGDGGLSLAEMGGDVATREEAFASPWAERIPGYGEIVKGSDRAYSGFLNKLRFDTAKSLLSDFRKLGVEPNAKQLRDIGRFVNNATGRGELGKIGGAAPLLNSLFYSPRLIASRVNLLNPVQYAKLDPKVRTEAIKSALAFGGIASTVLGLSAMGGSDIELDPRSTDFGKIRDGNVRQDILGGFQQYVRLASQLATNERKTLKGKMQDMGEGKYGQMNAYDDVAAFVRSKLNPIIGYMINSRVGSNPAGEVFDVTKDTLNLVIPLVAQDLASIYNELGPEGLAHYGLQATHGVSVQNFDPNKPRPKKAAPAPAPVSAQAPEETSGGETWSNVDTTQFTNDNSGEWEDVDELDK